MSGWWMWTLSVVLLGGCLLAVSQTVTTSSSFYEEPSLMCLDEGLEYSLQLMTSINGSVRLAVEDAEGNLTPLITNDTCRIWAASAPGIMEFYVQHDSCYVKKMGNYYTMAIFLEANTTGVWEVYEKEDLRCPVFQAMDAPTLGECSDVPLDNRLPCAGSSVTQELCLQNGCCYDQAGAIARCYYGNKVSAQCTTDGKITVAISKGVTVPTLILSSVKFLRADGPECGPVAQNDAFLLFSFPLSACGTTQTDGTVVVYENDLVAERDVTTWKGSSITRDSTFRLHIRCSFISSDSLPLKADVFTLLPPSLLMDPTSGLLTLEMRIAQDLLYSQYYVAGDYPILRVLRDPVSVEVRIMNRNDPGLVLMLGQCWATPSENPLQLPQWQILEDGCPFTGDNYKTQQVPVGSAVEFPSHYKRFIVSTFTFVDATSLMALRGLVYFHCSASICVPSPEDQCVTKCTTRKRRANDMIESPFVVSADGPVEFSMDEKGTPTTELCATGYISRTTWIWAVVAGSIFGIILVFVFLKKKKDAYSIKNINL